MSYLKDMQVRIQLHDYASFLKLWEEYCAGDEPDGEELQKILAHVKQVAFAPAFGRHVERILPLWSLLPETSIKYITLQLIIDLETTNTAQLAELAYTYLEKKFGTASHFQDWLRLCGLRSKENFQGAMSNVELLAHMQPHHFVFHTGGWGIGEIMDVSFLREQLILEFEYVPGRKDLSFANAFKTLVPVPQDHFLAQRFGNPQQLEATARKDPLEVIKILLRDLGPKTASEIKDELCDLVIPAQEWSKWWQATRAKMKKDTIIETPKEPRLPFRLRTDEVTHEELLIKAIEEKPEVGALIQMVYTFLRDFPEILRNGDFRAKLQRKLTELLSFKALTDAEELQIYFFLEDLEKDTEKRTKAVAQLLRQFPAPEDIVAAIGIIAFKKRTLVEIKNCLSHWEASFLKMLFLVQQNALRDYIFGELFASSAKEELISHLRALWLDPAQYPDAFLWYFQKILAQPDLPFGDQEGLNHFFEAFFILLHALERQPDARETVKKVHSLLAADRYSVVRKIIQHASLSNVQELLLLATKCYSLSDHDIKTLYSLAEVVHPAMHKDKRKSHIVQDAAVIWTTQEGYQKLQERIRHIGTVETVENAREIEIARAHGDLRENSEFKFALEQRERLQAELKLLSAQLQQARILRREDVSPHEIGVGAVVDCKDAENNTIQYTLLGPWDADPDRNILSFQSKIAQAMTGLKVGDSFEFQGTRLVVARIRNYFDDA